MLSSPFEASSLRLLRTPAERRSTMGWPSSSFLREAYPRKNPSIGPQRLDSPDSHIARRELLDGIRETSKKDKAAGAKSLTAGHLRGALPRPKRWRPLAKAIDVGRGLNLARQLLGSNPVTRSSMLLEHRGCLRGCATRIDGQVRIRRAGRPLLERSAGPSQAAGDVSRLRAECGRHLLRDRAASAIGAAPGQSWRWATTALSSRKSARSTTASGTR